MEHLFKLFELSEPERQFVLGFLAGVADEQPEQSISKAFAAAFADVELLRSDEQV